MRKYQALKEFLTTQNLPIPILDFSLDLVLSALFAIILSRIYIYCGTSISNRKLFSNNFILLSMATMLVISIVKASLALSLGLVGALSIVRFRAAIKEPEELSYLFLTIGIGLGFGAGQRLITISAYIIIIGIIIARKFIQTSKDKNISNLVLTVSSHNTKKVGLEKIVEILKNNCSGVEMKRVDEKKEVLEATFLVEFDDYEQFLKGKNDLQALDDSINITFIDNRGLI